MLNVYSLHRLRLRAPRTLMMILTTMLVLATIFFTWCEFDVLEIGLGVVDRKLYRNNNSTQKKVLLERNPQLSEKNSLRISLISGKFKRYITLLLLLI